MPRTSKAEILLKPSDHTKAEPSTFLWEINENIHVPYGRLYIIAHMELLYVLNRILRTVISALFRSVIVNEKTMYHAGADILMLVLRTFR